MIARARWLGSLIALSALALGACERPAPSSNIATGPVTAPAQTRPSAPSTAPTGQSAPTQPATAPAPPEAPPARPATAPTPVMVGGVASPFNTDGTRRTCAELPARAGYACVETPNGPTQVLSREAPADTDPCATAVCLPNTRCVATEQSIGGSAHRLPRCVPTSPLQNVVPTRDPCVSHLCPLGYHCTAPADAPYCVPDGAGW
jgi:hypothetical protein